MAAAGPPDPPEPTGPSQRGRGVRGQYVYWIVMPMPSNETVVALGLKRPTHFDSKTWGIYMFRLG